MSLILLLHSPPTCTFAIFFAYSALAQFARFEDTNQLGLGFYFSVKVQITFLYTHYIYTQDEIRRLDESESALMLFEKVSL